MKNFPLTLWPVAAFVVLTAANGFANDEPGGLSLAIVAAKDKSGTLLIDHGGKFQVVFTNRSKEPIRVWSRHCEPGYATLSFQVQEGKGLPSAMCPRSTDWDWKSTPTKIMSVPPGGSAAWDIELSEFFNGERKWVGVPEPNTGNPITLTALFEIKATDAAKGRGVWTGRIASEPVKALLVDPKLRTPHEYLWEQCPKQALRIMRADPTWIDKTDDMQRTPLHLAARFNFMEVARWLLDQGADVNARCYNNFTPLLLAKDPEMIKLLLEHKADVNALDAFESTALRKAAERYAYLAELEEAAAHHRYPGDTRGFDPMRRQLRTVMKMLLDAGAVYDIRSACYLGDVERVRKLLADERQAPDKSVLRIAAAQGDAAIVKLLLAHGDDPKDAQSRGGLTISYSAIDHPDVLKLLFDAGANPKVVVEYHGNGHGPRGSTLIHEAACRGNIESVKLLVSRGLDVNVRNSRGETILHTACACGDVPTVEWLLRNKADLTVRSKDGSTPMMAAAAGIRPGEDEANARRQAVIRVLEKAGAKLDLFSAIACDDVHRVSVLLQADPKAGENRDPAGLPALHQATTLDRREIVRLLLDKGCDPDVRSADRYRGYTKETALFSAAFWGRLEIAEMLIKHGASVNATAGKGVTPLHEAANVGNVELVRLLLEHGADTNAKDDKGETPLDWAGYGDDPEVLALLREHGGRKKGDKAN